jgi:hypothetical protein
LADPAGFRLEQPESIRIMNKADISVLTIRLSVKFQGRIADHTCKTDICAKI